MKYREFLMKNSYMLRLEGFSEKVKGSLLQVDTEHAIDAQIFMRDNLLDSVEVFWILESGRFHENNGVDGRFVNGQAVSAINDYWRGNWSFAFNENGISMEAIGPVGFDEKFEIGKLTVSLLEGQVVRIEIAQY